MKLIVGLGNPGEKYEHTRHNMGFLIIDSLVKELTPITKKPIWSEIKKPKLLLCKLDRIVLLKPQTYMNLSGLAVSYIKNFYKIDPRNIWVIHDDIDLPIGKLRIRRGGASAGHHGIDSLIKGLGEDNFVRFRVGIGKGKEFKELPERNLHRRAVERFVLSPFTTNEEGKLRKIIKKTVEAIRISLVKGIESGMNRFN